MFRIKTDIRHYQCESRDKVERLIRNWVIRPSDLIYDDDADDWHPIGEHPAFVELFESLDEHHENQPETVVTGRAADKAATDRAVVGGSDGEAPGAPRAAVLDREAPDDNGGSAPEAAVVRPDGGDDGETPEPPEPSEDVEGVSRDSDEITVMTDRTLSMMLEDDEEPSENAGAPEPEEPTARAERPDSDDENAPVGPEEPTARAEQPDSDDETSERAGPDEPTARVERPTPHRAPPEADAPAASDEPTNRLERPDFNKIPDEDSARSESEEEPDEPSSGRHDLPEHLFETAEIEKDEDSGADGDETGRGTSVDDSMLGLDSSPRVHRAIDFREAFPDRDPPPAFDVTDDADETGETAPDTSDDATDIDTSGDIDPYADTGRFEEPDFDDADTDEPEDDDSEPASAETADIDPYGETGDYEQPEPEAESSPPADDEDKEVEALDESTDPLSEDEEAGEPADGGEPEVDDEDEEVEELEEAEEIAAADIDPVDEEAADEDDPPLVEVEPVEEVYDGYDVDFLVPVEPTDESLEMGLQRSSAPDWARASLFSKPRPSTPGEVVTRTYDLEDDSGGSRWPLPISPTATAVVCGTALLVVLALVWLLIF